PHPARPGPGPRPRRARAALRRGRRGAPRRGHPPAPPPAHARRDRRAGAPRAPAPPPHRRLRARRPRPRWRNPRLMDALLTAFARHLGLPPEAARPALDVLLDTLREALDAEGAGTLDGVGRFYRRNGTVAFEPDPTLLAAINAPFAGLPPVAPAAPPPPPVAVAPPTPEEVPAPAEGEPEETDTTSALFTVPLEPGAPVEDDDEQVAPALD